MAKIDVRGFWSEVQRSMDARICTSLPSSLRIAWNGVFEAEAPIRPFAHADEHDFPGQRQECDVVWDAKVRENMPSRLIEDEDAHTRLARPLLCRSVDFCIIRSGRTGTPGICMR